MSKYNYSIADIGGCNDSWIFISYNDSIEDIDGTIELMKSIRDETNSDIQRIDPHDDVFILTNDPYKLKFQWDSLFGLVVILNKKSDRMDAIKLLNRHFQFLNQL